MANKELTRSYKIMRNLFYTLLVLLCFLTVDIQSQLPMSDILEVIDANNLDQIEQLMMFNRGTIEEMSWSPDGNRLAVGGSAGGWIYDVSDLQADPIHFAQFMRIQDVDFHPSSTSIISTGRLGAVYEWDSETGALIREIAPDPYNECPNCKAAISTVKISPDGQYIVIGATNSKGLLLLNYETSEILAALSDERPFEVFFSPNGEYIATHDSVAQNKLSVWSISSLLNSQIEPDYVLSDMPFSIWNIAWAHDSQSIFLVPFASDSGNLYNFDLVSETSSQVGFGRHVIDTSPEYIATRYSIYDEQWTSSINLLSVDTQETIWQVEVEAGATDLRFSPTGSFLAVGFDDGSLQLIDVENQQDLDTVSGTGAAITAIDLLSDEYLISMDAESYDVRTLTSGGACGVNTLRLWDLSTSQELSSWRSDTAEFGNFACGRLIVLPSSQQVILQFTGFGTQFDSEIIVFNPFSDDYFLMPLPFENERPYHNFRFKLSSDKTLLGIHAKGFHKPDEFFIYDVSNGLNINSQAIQVIVPPVETTLDFVFSADNQNIIISDSTGQLTIWDIQRGEPDSIINWDIPAYFNSIDLTLSPDASLLAVNHGLIDFFDAQTYEYLSNIVDRDWGVGENIEYNIMSSWFVTHKRYDTYRLWNAQTEIFYPLPARANSIAFSSDDTFFVTGGTDGAIRIWGIPSDNAE